MFRAIVVTKETMLNVIVFGFPKGTMSSLSPGQRLEAITGQNPALGSGLHRVGVLKGPQAKSVEAVILGFNGLKAANKAIDTGVL